jgi:hypothetical protein
MLKTKKCIKLEAREGEMPLMEKILSRRRNLINRGIIKGNLSNI